MSFIYQSLIVTLAVSATVFKIFRLKDKNLLILPTPPLFDASQRRNAMRNRRNAQQNVHLVGCNFVTDIVGLSSVIQPLLPPKIAKSGEIPTTFDLTAVQGHPRSSILVSTESQYVTSYQSLIVTLSPVILLLHPHTHPLLQLNLNFSSFTPASESEISKILFNCPNKQSDFDPIPTWLLKVCAPVLILTITNIVNLSLTSGHFHPYLKNLSSPHFSRNLLQTKTNFPTIGQSPTCLSYPK